VRLNIANVDELASGYDLMIDGTDNFPTRYLVNDSCVRLGVPLVWGSIFQFDAQVAAFWRRPPLGSGALAVQLRDLFPAPPPAGSVPSRAEGGVLGALCGQVGSVMATSRQARYWSRGRAARTSPGPGRAGGALDPDPACHRHDEVVIAAAQRDDLEDRCGVGSGGRGVAGLDLCVATLTAHQLNDRLADRAAGGEALLLVDVRDPESGPSWRSRAPMPCHLARSWTAAASGASP
jgi:adenylyltransferase/sulfurtransferase